MNQKDAERGMEGEEAKQRLPPVIFGTSSLGNLFVALDEDTKLEIVKECLRLSGGNILFDCAGKYGAGLALEVLGRCLKRLNIAPDQVTISNKLAWVRSELKTNEPTFEPGVWKDLKFDAVQKISYDGILECFEQGNELLNGYVPQMLSVHDPDEYLAAATGSKDSEKRYNDVLDAYEALFDLRRQGKVKGIGVGAKDWRIIRRIVNDVPLDWVMIANSMTVKTHPRELLEFMEQLKKDNITVINAAVYHSGFLVGGNYFDYRLITSETPGNEELYQWRTDFFEVCNRYNVKPAAACIQFSLNAPGVSSIAVSTTEIKRIEENMIMAETPVPVEFWEALKTKGLIETYFKGSRSSILQK